MTDNVAQEEVQAILDAVREEERARPAEVVTRDFREPRRLSRERLEFLKKLIRLALRDACSAVAAPLRRPARISLASISEVDTTELLHDMETPFSVHCFQCAGQVSWLIWDSAAASTTAEAILSGGDDAAEEEQEEAEPAPPPAPRRLSRSECRVLESLFTQLLTPITAVLGLDVQSGNLAQEPDELVTLDGSGLDADPRRLMLHFLFEGPGFPSELRVYLPDLGNAGADAREEGSAEATRLPGHLETVKLSVAAFLGSVDIPLNDLLELEVGDVIPLGIDRSEGVEVYVEDRPCGVAEWGRFHGNLAIKIRELDTRLGGIDQPSVRDQR